MHRVRNTFNTKHLLSSFTMLLVLAWLTVCLPYVYEGQQKQKHHTLQQTQGKETADDNSNPLTNTTEEKAPGGMNSLSEYLHEPHSLEQHFIILSSSFNHHICDVYFSFHPEKVSPPPKA